ncbi:hypothetical protein [Vibrio algivorus]|uniref:hypothetical protein n=1 Tax=Vibrio algivorus TaxID=1667024 RepID=UPI00164309C0|nr:hypothetical protein [Vibrio algivorus]
MALTPLIPFHELTLWLPINLLLALLLLMILLDTSLIDSMSMTTHVDLTITTINDYWYY